MLQDLVKHQGWDLLAKYGAQQIRNRSNDIVFTPISEQKGQYEQEYRKGECSGMYTMLHLPETIIEETKVQLTEMRRNESLNEDEDE